jgi:hypothetical protein
MIATDWGRAMSKPYVMRQAASEDFDAVVGLIEDRTAWLRRRGSDQWDLGTGYQRQLARRVERGLTWLMEDEGNPVATVTLLRRRESTLWTADELAEPTVFGWKLATAVDRGGRGLAGLLCRWAMDRAARLDVTWLRGSVWGTSVGLHAYYKTIGSAHVRTVAQPSGLSVALFQLPARRFPEVSLEVLTRPRLDLADSAPLVTVGV